MRLVRRQLDAAEEERLSGAGRVLVAFAGTLLVMFLVPLPIYGTFEALGWVELPQDGSPWRFMLSVLVIKVGVAVAFVLLFRLARPGLRGRSWPYAAIWWVMFAIIEAGQAIGPGYSAAEAVAGVLSEAIYFPLSAAWVARALREERRSV